VSNGFLSDARFECPPQIFLPVCGRHLNIELMFAKIILQKSIKFQLNTSLVRAALSD